MSIIKIISIKEINVRIMKIIKIFKKICENNKNHEIIRNPFENQKLWNSYFEIHARITKIMEFKEVHENQKKIMIFLEIHVKITKILKIIDIHSIIMTI